METPKRDIVIDKGPLKNSFNIYADASAIGAIAQVEGVLRIFSVPGGPYRVTVNPRYDADEVIADIKQAVINAKAEQTEAIIAEARQITSGKKADE